MLTLVIAEIADKMPGIATMAAFGSAIGATALIIGIWRRSTAAVSAALAIAVAALINVALWHDLVADRSFAPIVRAEMGGRYIRATFVAFNLPILVGLLVLSIRCFKPGRPGSAAARR